MSDDIDLGTPEVVPETAKDELRAEVVSVAKAVDTTPGSSGPLSELGPIAQLQHQDFQQDINLKKTYSRIILGAVLLQLVVSNAVFVAYAWIGMDWQVPSAVIGAWFSATIVEMIGLAWVVTKYLFPNRDGPFSNRK